MKINRLSYLGGVLVLGASQNVLDAQSLDLLDSVLFLLEQDVSFLGDVGLDTGVFVAKRVFIADTVRGANADRAALLLVGPSDVAVQLVEDKVLGGHISLDGVEDSLLTSVLDQTALSLVVDRKGPLGLRDGHLGGAADLDTSAIFFAVVDGLENGQRGGFLQDVEFHGAFLALDLVGSLNFVLVDAEFRAVDLELDFEVVTADNLGVSFDGQSS